MPRDRREEILTRLLTIGTGIEGVIWAERNPGDVPESKRPAFVLLDADEQAEETPGARANAPRLVRMTPDCLFLIREGASNLGTDINAMRVKFLRAVLSDGTLKNIVGPSGRIQYEGFSSALAKGRSLEGEAAISLTFVYPLIAHEL